VTIYKWWPNRGAVAIDAYFHRYRQTLDFVDTGDVASDLAAQLRLLIDAFSGRAGEVMAELIGQAQTDPGLAATLGSGWLQPRREATAAVLRHAIDRGQIRPDVDVPTLMDQLYAPLYWRLMMRHAPLTDDFAEMIVRKHPRRRPVRLSHLTAGLVGLNGDLSAAGTPRPGVGCRCQPRVDDRLA